MQNKFCHVSNSIMRAAESEGIFGEATTLAPGNWQGHVWQGHVWNTVLAILLWLVWFYG